MIFIWCFLIFVQHVNFNVMLEKVIKIFFFGGFWLIEMENGTN